MDEKFRPDDPRIRVGMKVRSADGQKVGKVVGWDESGRIVVENGYFFPREFVVHTEDVAGVAGDLVRLAVPRRAVAEAPDEGPEPLAGEEVTMWTQEHPEPQS